MTQEKYRLKNADLFLYNYQNTASQNKEIRRLKNYKTSSIYNLQIQQDKQIFNRRYISILEILLLH